MEVLPGATVVEKFTNAERFGFDAVELPGRSLPDYRNELLAHLGKLPLPVSSLSLGFRGSLVSADPESRRRCREDIPHLLALCRQLGAIGLVIPPALRQDNPRIVDASLRDQLLFDQLPGLAGTAAGLGVSLLLEAVNRQEADYMNTVGHAVAICERVNHPGLGVVVDFFHMQFEEQPVPEIIHRAGSFIRHVHVADHNRLEPSAGRLDFRPGFRALREISYAGSIVVECRALSGDAATVLPRSARYLQELMQATLP